MNELSFDSSFLDLPIIKADPGLCAVLDRHAEELLAKYPPEDSLVEQARAIIKDGLNGGDTSVERVAEKLRMSARTLQRKLQEHGTSHQELLDQLRKDLSSAQIDYTVMNTSKPLDAGLFAYLAARANSL